MTDHDIKGITLAKRLEYGEATVSRLKRRKEMPSLNGKKLDLILNALSEISGKRIRLKDLVEETDSEAETTNY